MNRPVITYEPDNVLRKGYFSTLGQIFKEIRNNRWLTWQLFKRDLFGTYKQSFIGILWIFIVPLVSVVTFILLNGAGVFSFGDIDVPFPLYAMLGMAIWQLFAAGLIAGSGSLISAGSMVTQINFSRKSLVFASVAQSIVAFLVMVAIVCGLFVWYAYVPNVAILLIPIIVIPLIFLALGLAFIFSILNVVVRDIGGALSIVITFLMFLTPVLYARPIEGVLGQLTQYNPLYYLVTFPRDIIMTGTSSPGLMGGYLLSSLFCIIVFFIGIVIFHLSETRIAERI